MLFPCTYKGAGCDCGLLQSEISVRHFQIPSTALEVSDITNLLKLSSRMDIELFIQSAITVKHNFLRNCLLIQHHFSRIEYIT